MNKPKIKTTVEGCFTYVKETDNKGFVLYKVNTTNKEEALNLYNKESNRVSFVGSLHWLD